MKGIRSRYQQSKINSHSISVTTSLKLVIAPFTEQDILHLHKALLTPGFHYFHVLNVDAGRLFMQQFLNSLHYYNNIGYLAATTGTKEYNFRDILEELQENGFLYKPYFLDEFFIDNFDYDFIWIETTAQLYTLSWYKEFQNKLNEYNVPAHIPVVILSYEQEQ